MTENSVQNINNNIVVTLDYALEVDGNQIDSGPIQFIQGHGNIIPGLESALEGSELGQEKEILVKAEDAYGQYDPDMEIDLPRTTFPGEFEIKLGRPMRLQDDKGQIFTGTAIGITDEMIKLNLNHPLAGKDLLFKTNIKALRMATEEEIAQGRLVSSCSGCSSCNGGDCG